MITAQAPAKVNLALHVTGQRADGYSLLDSIVVFCTLADHLSLRPGPLSLRITGPEGAGLSSDQNLILDAARLIGATAQITLEKRLPVAAGIGGGSADAAAALRGLHALSGRPIPDQTERLGADVPMCLAAAPARARGIGEDLTPLPPLPRFALLLVNPRVPVSTGAVFARLARRDFAPLPAPPHWRDASDLAGWLSAQRNDLEPPACALAPEIGTALAAIRTTPGCLLARMSGSGATCFGIFATLAEAQNAARAMPAPWWAEATEPLGPRPDLVARGAS